MMVARANNDGDEKLPPPKFVSEFFHVLKSYRLRVFSGKETKSPRPVSWRRNVETQ